MSSDPPVVKRRFYRALFKENKDLLRAVLGFNARWRTQNMASGLTHLGLPPTLEAYIGDSPFLAQDDSGFWDFEEDSRRIMLVETELLEKGIRYWGAAFCSSLIRSAVSREDQMEIQGQIGKELMAYAMGRGRFYLGQARALVPLDHANSPADQTGALVRACGAKALMIVAGGWPRGLEQRAKQTLQTLFDELDLESLGPESPVPPSQQRLLWGVLKNIFIREVAPQWHPCFL